MTLSVQKKRAAMSVVRGMLWMFGALIFVFVIAPIVPGLLATIFVATWASVPLWVQVTFIAIAAVMLWIAVRLAIKFFRWVAN